MLFLHIFDTSVLRNTPDFTSHCLVRNMPHFAKQGNFSKIFLFSISKQVRKLKVFTNLHKHLDFSTHNGTNPKLYCVTLIEYKKQLEAFSFKWTYVAVLFL